jgi:gluconokinase
MQWIVCMGVAGSGKTSLGALIASRLRLPFIEGDEFHSEQSQRKMRAGHPLDDADRAQWLDVLGHELADHRGGAVLACSALKRAYRDRLRAAVPAVRFLFLDIDRALATERVSARGGAHLFPASLVESQFTTLEPPSAEPDVLRLHATDSLEALAGQAVAWLAAGGA